MMCGVSIALGIGVVLPVASSWIGVQRTPRLLWVFLLLFTLQSFGLALLDPQQEDRLHLPRSPKRFARRTDPLQEDTKEDALETRISPELEFLADFAGKNRLWVITAPSYTDNYLRMMEKQIQDMEAEGLSCHLAQRDTLIVTIIQNAMMEGKIRWPSFQGDGREESMDTDMVTKLLHYLDLEDQTFGMLILKKNLKVGERFPYAVRVAAVLEVIDQLPVRKLEMMTRKGAPEKCKVIKKRVLVRKRGPVKKKIFSPQRQGNFTSVPRQQKPLDKKAALKSQVQSILNGRSRFVIRKDPVGVRGPQTSATERSNSRSAGENGRKQDTGSKTTGGNTDSAAASETNKQDQAATEKEERREGADLNGVKGEAEKENGKSKSKKKDKGKKKHGKKGKRGGKKSQEDENGKDKKALQMFLEKLNGKRRLMVMIAPGESNAEYVQQKRDNEQSYCELAMRKVSLVTILGSEHNGSLYLQHYQLDTEPPLDLGPDKFTDLNLISQMRKEFKMHRKDFSLALTDYDLQPRHVFDAPISSQVMMDYVDTFPTRESEKRNEKRKTAACPKHGDQGGTESSLLRFMSKRRLLIISTPSEEDYSFQQQLQALNGQACHMGKSQSEHEPLTADMVNGLRGHLKITREYFSMLVVGKDGDVKAWFPSPMWSLVNIYDLVDSMELRQQEQKLQSTLGIHCPDDVGSSVHGYDDEGEEGYLYRKTED
ncbi:hypothetical protein JZ751_016036 [Albula glossodonta]|uniref:DUF4174 domain-containing protein n=1 Tax=Albula glossodonta TaxID=121402 RepID=A0A8T2NU12_9TELE|nr:hypothetical protein JZ751_016036 [Albula glossodonta]